jgi:hypothetical protein
MRAPGPEAFAISPMYRTGTHLLGDMLRLSQFEEAMRRSVMISDERRHYLSERWQHWSQKSVEEAESGQQWTHQLGYE